MRKQIKINGITTTGTCEDGDCRSLVNLREKYGTLHPVSPRKVEQALSDTYDIVFIHSSNGYERWLGVKYENRTSSIYWDINAERKLILETSDKIHSLEQIGNTISVITENDILYLLFTENNYKLLGTIPEIEPIEYSYEALYKEVENTITKPGEGAIEDDDIKNLLAGLFNKCKKELFDENNGCLFDAHLMVFAFQLYDGSAIKQTSPVIITNPAPIPCQYTITKLHIYH